jgi:hypothetical protein
MMLDDEANTGPSLSAADQAALDRLIDRAFEAQAGEGEDAAREQAVLEVLRALDAYPVEASDPSLVDATLARIDAAEREQAARLRLDRAPRRRTAWADLGGIAAVILIAAGVAWPMLGRMRASALQSSCANNLRAMGAGLSTYANDHRDFLPVTAGLSSLLSPNPSTLDWNTYEHSGNLVAMANKGYCSMSAMQCPACASGTPHKHFAFRMPASDRPFRLKVVARGALVADANPALELRRAGKPAGSNMASWNHAQSGQNVLFGDGAILWLNSPEVDGDNLFLPRGVHRADLLPNVVQLPQGSDAFLAQ